MLQMQVAIDLIWGRIYFAGELKYPPFTLQTAWPGAIHPSKTALIIYLQFSLV